tara:strand:- start:24 stop:257 length:234 start_codon:yes stop_codon:yes gene_type:complete
MPPKKNVKKIKNIDSSVPSYHQKIIFKVQEDVKPDKIKPVEIFDEFKDDSVKKKVVKKRKKMPLKNKNIINKTPLHC